MRTRLDNEKKTSAVQHNTGDSTLNESLGKLDELLSDIREKQNSLKHKQSSIPVLDDLIHPGDIETGEKVFHEYRADPPAIREQDYNLTELIDSLEIRIADELDTVIDILKESIKDSILTELKTRIKDSHETTKYQFPPKD